MSTDERAAERADANRVGSAAIQAVSDRDLLRIRMHALGLSDSAVDDETGPRGVQRVVQERFALQGQDWRASRWAVGIRSTALLPSDVHDALSEGRIVRSWPMRSTVHLVAAEDIGWMQAVTNARPLAGAPKRREYLGITDRALQQITDTTIEALTGGAGLTREALAGVWDEAGIEWQPNWRYHLIWWLCQNGITTFGPVAADAGGRTDPEPRLVLAREWISDPRTLTGDDASAEFAARYLRGRGAASAKDLATWAGIGVREARQMLALAAEAERATRIRRSGVSGSAGELWADPHALDAGPHEPLPEWQLLPAFDEHLLGFQDRTPQLADGMLAHVLPAKNGVFLATVLNRGRVVGTWRRESATSRLFVSSFPGEIIDPAGLAPAITRLHRFYDFDPSRITVS